MKNTRNFAIIIALIVSVLSLGVISTSTANAQRVTSLQQSKEVINTKAVVRWYDVNGKVIAKRTFHPSDGKFDITQVPSKRAGGCEDLICHFTGRAGPNAGGTARVDAIQTGSSTLGSKIWSWDVWSKWSWNHPTACIQKCTVTLIDKGTIGKGSTFWAFDRVVATDNHYLTSCNAHCGYHHSAKGQFHGANITNHDAYRRPTNTLNSYNDGTFEVWKSCC